MHDRLKFCYTWIDNPNYIEFRNNSIAKWQQRLLSKESTLLRNVLILFMFVTFPIIILIVGSIPLYYQNYNYSSNNQFVIATSILRIIYLSIITSFLIFAFKRFDRINDIYHISTEIGAIIVIFLVLLVICIASLAAQIVCAMVSDNNINHYGDNSLLTWAYLIWIILSMISDLAVIYCMSELVFRTSNKFSVSVETAIQSELQTRVRARVRSDGTWPIVEDFNIGGDIYNNTGNDVEYNIADLNFEKQIEAYLTNKVALDTFLS